MINTLIKMGKKSKKPKNHVVTFRSQLERIDEIEKIKVKLKTLGLGDGIPEIDGFYKETGKFIETGETISGKIAISGFKRVLEYNFNNNKKYSLSINLKYSDSI